MTETVTIKYDHGQMTVNLKEFLEDRKIGKVKKLTKLADSTHNYELREQLIKHIEKRIPLLESSAKIYANRYVDLRTKIKELQYEMKTVRRTSVTWKSLSMEVKELTKEMNHHKKMASAEVKNLEFYKKVHDVLS